MRVSTVTEPGDPARDNEDWVTADPDLVIVLDGATARTATGCAHGIAWYARNLGAAIATRVQHPDGLRACLAESIAAVAALHLECDLDHPGTPSAAVAVVHRDGDVFRYLVLGDVTVVFDLWSELRVVSDQRVSDTALAERREADRHPIGSAEKHAALLAMKPQELAARNTLGGYWIAANDPEAARHALTGQVAVGTVRRLAVLSDGAARSVDLLGLDTWWSALALMHRLGPAALVRRVREAEASDPQGTRWPRNKASDDATAVFALCAWPPENPAAMDTDEEHYAAAGVEFLDLADVREV